MRVTTIIIIIAILVGGYWYAKKEGYIGAAREKADSFEANYAKGMKLYNDMKYDEALAAFEKAKAKGPGHGDYPILLRRMGDCYKEKRDYAKCLEYYQQLVDDYPDHKIANNTKNAIEEVKAIGHF